MNLFCGEMRAHAIQRYMLLHTNITSDEIRLIPRYQDFFTHFATRRKRWGRPGQGIHGSLKLAKG
jgi:hypothetical protein